MTGGYAPGGAVIVTDRIARHFDDHVLVCGLTSYGHPLVCEAIVAAIESYRDEELVDARGGGGRAPARRCSRISPASAPTSARCAASACCGPSSSACRGPATPLPAATMAKVAAALRRIICTCTSATTWCSSRRRW